MNPRDDAFPGTGDDRCVAEVDAYIKGENLRRLADIATSRFAGHLLEDLANGIFYGAPA